ncbi:succinylglutamate desuccinylase/aspartoacylase family protein [Rhodospirillum rubrum]|uniref:Succinylglutamate desuccinylase/aspartoacylase n=1 Tax=Rhodospirillum rubrum (strain ATCC 11170 / ATH 1.1.1 / DSM 467 / LMG 4362 / NCIMB 8255 / S1) TaxID=269796 RepID=Q2RSW4_RHORT|nr:succinylglutamate desuccinylase/aspartoacylase family protein [Rhodospirillum rubrum]ABC22781.1 Succinylglutamate desuccinylase/aspartoacylase [Rhodospirillum rubrum ATCC 11170]AEO48502.1 succinylglutamate desuccinylase/aspartoacylase [Rhodospirillum rubrum F11]MBK5954378.1 succinylglutamate desuccinylase [Rhodospirillum rubrum]QXG78770.1 succinylglutamate desuccinylase/aspartoacylase family protein [Rhodospirillum rubrum]HAQ01496.1 succinylglutamate desuccinylase [Rhodospirillum rubrum]
MVERISLPLPGPTPGTSRALGGLRYGRRGARPKAYLQAALHADELPGVVVLDHLARLLDRAEAEGRITGEIILVPLANPIGLGQRIGGMAFGRFDLDGGGNFNRHYGDYAPAALAVAEDLGADPGADAARVREALSAAWAGTKPPPGEVAALRHTLQGLALDADLALDLHCDLDAVVHLYGATADWPAAEDIARLLGAEAVLLADHSGDQPFDESLSGPWTALAARRGAPLPGRCLALTVELRGAAEVDDALAAKDARALAEVLTRRGLISGAAAPLPEWRGRVCPLAAVDMVAAPVSGVMIYRRPVGAMVETGEVIGEILDPLAEGAARRVGVLAGTSGPIFARLSDQRLVRAGDIVCKIAGQEPLAHRTGTLLTA